MCNILLISELIKKLEAFKDKHGDLPVYHTIGFVADVEIDTVNLVRGSQCLLGNKYLDNYTMRTEDKILDLQKDMMRYANDNLDCSHCALYFRCYIVLSVLIVLFSWIKSVFMTLNGLRQTF